MIVDPEHATHDGCPLLLWRLAEPVLAASTTVLGGGVGRRSWLANLEVGIEYHDDPEAHLARLAVDLGLDRASGVGFLTAARVADVATALDDGAECAATVGVSTPTWAAANDGAWARWGPGTINIVGFVPAPLSPAALLNTLVTVTEAKAQALFEASVPGTGTASDAVAVCCPAGGTETYGGPRSTWGARLARATHAAVADGLARYLEGPS